MCGIVLLNQLVSRISTHMVDSSGKLQCVYNVSYTLRSFTCWVGKCSSEYVEKGGRGWAGGGERPHSHALHHRQYAWACRTHIASTSLYDALKS